MLSISQEEADCAQNPEAGVDQGNASDDNVKIMSMGNDTKKYNKGNTSSKKHGRPWKNGENTKPATPVQSPESAKTIVKHMQRKQRRVSNPSPYQLSPYQSK